MKKLSKKPKVKIQGYGEIGQSIERVYIQAGWDQPAVLEKDYQRGEPECDILHVCFPYSDEFAKLVIQSAHASKAKYVIIHSTVKPQTTLGVLSGIKKGVTVCHSPVIGVHPNLTEGILTFKKWIGCEKVAGQDPQFIEDHFHQIGIKSTQIVYPAVTTEACKLWDTTYYGVCLAVNAEVKCMLDAFGISYEVWTEYLKCYNNGYHILGKGNVRRPYFHHLEMPIGGHCVVPNARILQSVGPSPAYELILKYAPKLLEK